MSVAPLEQALNDLRLSSDKPESEPASTSSKSTSEDDHKGNGIACRFYNHDGCRKGEKCKFSHGPDSKSVRDRVGKNVCLYFLLGTCKFGDFKCIYSHSKDNLAEDGWWNDDDQVAEVRETLENKGKKTSASGRANRYQRRRRLRVPRYLLDIMAMDSDEDDWNPAYEKYDGMLGFTDDDIDELLSQGVKPWDDDAHAVLDALYF